MAEKVVIGNAELWLGDCREVLPFLPTPDLVLTDPPYGIQAAKKKAHSRVRDRECWPPLSWDDEPGDIDLLLTMDCKKIIWGGNYFQVPASRGWLIWDKNNPPGFTLADAELAWTNLDLAIRKWSGWNPLKSGQEKYHPTQKPVDLMAWCLGKVPDAKTVCDPFMGSGTTGIACAMLGKDFTGIERERRYFDLACERIALAQAQGQLLPHEQKPVAVQEALL